MDYDTILNEEEDGTLLKEAIGTIIGFVDLLVARYRELIEDDLRRFIPLVQPSRSTLLVPRLS